LSSRGEIWGAGEIKLSVILEGAKLDAGGLAAVIVWLFAEIGGEGTS
jgi:hypothetical protein